MNVTKDCNFLIRKVATDKSPTDNLRKIRSIMAKSFTFVTDKSG